MDQIGALSRGVHVSLSLRLLCVSLLSGGLRIVGLWEFRQSAFWALGSFNNNRSLGSGPVKLVALRVYTLRAELLALLPLSSPDHESKREAGPSQGP